MPARDPATPAADGGGRPSREDGLRRAAKVTTSLVAVSAAGVVGFGVLAHDHRAGSAGVSTTTSDPSGDGDNSRGGTGGRTSPFGGPGGGLVSGGGGGFHAQTGGS